MNKDYIFYPGFNDISCLELVSVISFLNCCIVCVLKKVYYYFSSKGTPLQDEDYMIENYVEYDQDGSSNLEIDETNETVDDTNDNDDDDDDIETAPLVQRNHKTVADFNKQESNVGKRILQTTNKGHACKDCDKKFFEKTMLEEHERTAHKTPRPYSCNICNKRFTHKNYVNLHMRVHTGEKPYKCNLCSRSYSHKTSYTIHMRIHNGDRPYTCNICGKKCYDKSGWFYMLVFYVDHM